MIETPTVLILGAGASMPFKFPSGRDLLWQIYHNLSDKTLQFKQLESFGFSNTKIQLFINTMVKSGKPSVDAFLEHRKEFIDIGKIAIAQTLLPMENTNNLFFQKNESWYDYLYKKMNAPYVDFHNNKISIITFNYDRSLEHYLINVLTNTYGKSEAECAIIIQDLKIIHLYGKLGNLDWENPDAVNYDYLANPSPEKIKKAADMIKIIHEDIDIENDPELNEAREILSQARRIYFIGLGYDNTNLDRLKMRNLALIQGNIGIPNQQIRGTCFHTSGQERVLIKQYFNENISLAHENVDAYNFIRDVPLD